MLVLSRDCGESFTIGDNIKITVIRAANGRARIGIEAPGQLPILRTDAIKKTKTPPPGQSNSQATANPA